MSAPVGFYEYLYTLQKNERESEYQQRYKGWSYNQLSRLLRTMPEGEEKDWLSGYYMSDDVMTVADYDRLIADKGAEMARVLGQEQYQSNDWLYVADRLEATRRQQAAAEKRKEFDRELEQLQAGRWRVQNKEKYGSLQERTDFDKNSKVAADKRTTAFSVNIGGKSFGIGDPVYDYINDLDGEQTAYQMRQAGSDFNDRYKYSFMTDTEVSTYNYLYNTEGKKAANDYLDTLSNQLNSRRVKQLATENAEYASDHPGLASVYSVPANLAGGAGLLDVAWQNAVKNITEGVTGEYAGPIDYNRAAMNPAVATQAIRGAVAENLAEKGTLNFDAEEHPVAAKLFNGKSWGDVYQLGMSMADSAAVAALSPVVGAAGTALLGGAAGTQGMLDALERGATDEQALTMGMMSGAFEMIFEKVSLDRLLSGNTRNVVKKILSQGLVEGSEEFSTSFANQLADVLVMAENSNYRRNVAAYMEMGLMEEEAERRAFEDAAIEMAWDFVGGAISGGIMGAGFSAPGAIANSISTKKEIKADRTLIANAAAQRLTELGETGDVKAISSALAKQAAGKKLDANDQRILKESKYGTRVFNELQPHNIESGNYTSDWTGNIGTKRIHADEYNRLVKAAEAEESSTAVASTSTADEMKATEAKPTGNETVDAVIYKAQGKELSGSDVRPILEDAEAVKALETVTGPLDLKGKSSSEQRGIVQEAVTKYAAENPVTVAAHKASKAVPTNVEAVAQKYGKQAAAVRSIYNLAPVENVENFANAFEAAYQIGLEGGLETSAVRSEYTQALSETQRRMAYATGKDMRQANKGKTRKSGEGIVRLRGMKGNDVNKRFKRGSNQKTATEILRTISKLTGATIELFDSEGDYSMEQGSFDWDDDVIRIDIASGICKAEDVEQLAKYVMLRTFCHEFTHFSEKWAAEEYSVLRAAVIEALSANEDFDLDARIKYIQESQGLSWDMASREVVAEAMTDVLPESKFMQSLIEKDPNLAERLIDELKKFLARVKGYYRELVSNPSPEAQALKVEVGGVVKYLDGIVEKWDAMALAAVENYQNAELKPDAEGVVVNEDGEPVAHSVGNGTIQLSMRTYEEDGRKAFREYLEKCVSSKRITNEEMTEMLDGIEDIYKVCKEFKDKYAPFSSWSDAEVIKDTYGKPVFSVVTPNGDYKMNLDFSLVCKKRRTLDAVFNEMSRRGIIDDFELGQKSVVKINEIIRKHGLETACALCFVDAKRFRQASMADSFTRLYNELVLSLVPEELKGSIDHFNFAGYETISKVEDGIHTWDKSKLDFSHLDDVMKNYGKGTVEHKAAMYIKNNPEGRKLLLRGDFMSSQGFDAVKTQNKNVLKLYNSKKGTGGPKAAFGDVQYMNEVIRKAKSWTPAKAYAVGGVRIQSFSDYVPRMVFDYVQMIYDLAATKMPAHAYTKEALFVKQFGLTGVKINMSLIPAIDKNGIAPGLDANGDYVWAGESFDFETAKQIQNAEGYSENCGTICVGVSKQHINKLLSDPDIRMVIPYHKSGLNPIVAHMNKIAAFTDYTDSQRTKGADGTAIAKDFDFNKALHDMGENGSPKAVAKQYLDWCAANGYTPKFDDFAWHENYYKLLEDFTLYDKDGKYVPQREVRAVFPKADNAFGSMKELIEEGLQEDAIIQGKRDSNLSSIVDEIEKSLPKTEAEIEEVEVEQADRDVEAEAIPQRQYSRRVSFEKDKYFDRQIDKWEEKPDGARIKVGVLNEGSALNKVGFPAEGMWFDVGKIKKSFGKHGDHLTKTVLKAIPDLLNDPIAITEYKGAEGDILNTVNVFGMLMPDGKTPIVVGVVMTKARNGITIINKIRTIHARGNADINDDNILYLNEDKKRTQKWFQVCGNSVPLEGTKFGLIRSISYTEPVSQVQKQHRNLNETQRKAAEIFGTTTDFNEAGFILPSGEMLKFTDDKHKGERLYDHRAIGMAYGVDVDLSVNHGFNEDSARHLENFIEDGGIRFDPGDPDLDMDAGMQLSSSVPLTKEQELVIRDFVEWKQQREEAISVDEDSLYSGPLALHIEFGGKAGIAVGQSSKNLDAWGVKHLSYEGGQINASRILTDIRHYYQTGEVRQPSELARFRYQVRTQSYTDREVLEMAAEDVSNLKLSEGERSALEIFNKRLDKLKKLEEQRDEQRQILAELNKAEKPDAEEIRKTRSRLNVLGRRISAAENDILAVEDKKTLKKVLHAARRVVERENRASIRENDTKTAMRHKVKDIVKELNDYLLKGTKDKHVMIGLQKAVASALDVVNMDTVGAAERIAKLEEELVKAKTPEKILEISRRIENVRKMGDKMSDKLASLKAAYAEIKDSDDPLIANSIDEVLEAKTEYVAKQVGDTPLRDMSMEQLEEVYELYQMVLTRIRESNKAFAKNKKESIDQLASNTQMEVEAVGGKKKFGLKSFGAVNSFLWNNFKPLYAFKAIGSKTLSSLFENVRAGEDVWAKDVSEARAFFLEQSKKHNYNSWDMEETHTFTSTSGLEFKLNLEQMMSIYAYSKREQAEDHLKYGGIVFENSYEKVKVGKSKYEIKLKTEDATAYNISSETVAEIVDILGKEKTAFVDAMQDYLSTVMGEKGNEVSLAMYGVKLFKEKHYFPLRSSPAYMARAREQANGEVKIKNKGFTKETNPHAKNPIVLEGFMDVWASHADEMSMYHAFTLPLEDFYRVYNYKTPNNNPNLPAEGVNPAIVNAYGRAATNYIEQMLKDLNGGARSDPTAGIINKLMGNFKKGAVYASASVLVQQPSSVTRALALIDAKYFRGKAIDAKKHKALWEEVKQYAPVAIIKEMGYFDTNTGKSTVDFLKSREYTTGREKLEALAKDGNYRDEVLSKAPALADEYAWCQIWMAVKRETAAKHPGLETSSEAFLEVAGKRFTQIVTETQVYDSVLSRSANMRSKDTGMKMATAFLAEPTTAINMVANALIQGKRGDKAYAGKAVGAVIAAQIINSALAAIVYAGRDDDEDETYLEKYLGSFVGGVIDSMNPFTYIPFAKDIVSIVQGYDVERSDMAAIADLWNAIDQLDSNKVTNWKKAEDLIGNLAIFFGLPVKNIMRDARGLYQTFDSVLNGENITAAGLGYAVKGTVTGKDVSNAYQLLEARIKGDKAHEERVMARFDDEKDANSVVRKAIKESFDDGTLTADEAMLMLENYAGAEDEDDAYWKVQEWIGKADAEASGDEDYSFSAYNDVYEAVRSGGDFNAAVKEMVSHGYKEEDVISQVKTKIGKWYKDGEITKQQATSMLGKYGELDAEDIEEKLKAWDFKKENGFEYSDRAEAYFDGRLSRNELRDILMDMEGYTAEKADEQIEVYDWEAEGHEHVTAARIRDYDEHCKSENVPKDIYLEIRYIHGNTENDKDENGKSINYSALKKIMDVINSYPLSSEQKDAVARSIGWSEKNIRKYKVW